MLDSKEEVKIDGITEKQNTPSSRLFNPIPRTFTNELMKLINKHLIEKGSNTPDFILAVYLKQCLEAFNTCVRQRDKWFNR